MTRDLGEMQEDRISSQGPKQTVTLEEKNENVIW